MQWLSLYLKSVSYSCQLEVQDEATFCRHKTHLLLERFPFEDADEYSKHQSLTSFCKLKAETLFFKCPVQVTGSHCTIKTRYESLVKGTLDLIRRKIFSRCYS